MRLRAPAFFAALIVGPVLCLAASARAAARTVETRIRQVTVYPGMARVSRTGKLELSAGTHLLKITNLPLSLQQPSLQVSAKGPGGTKLLGVEAAAQHEPRSDDPEVRKLEGQIEEKQLALGGIDDERKSLEAQIEFLKSLSQGISGRAGESIPTAPHIDVQGWESSLKFFEKQNQRVRSQLRELPLKEKRLREELAALNRRLAELRGKRRSSYVEVEVELALPQPGTVSLDVAYLIWGANWSPHYEGRVSTENETLELAYQGIVTQSTGEDWNGVALTLSTAKPSLNQTLPELDPWFLDVRRPPQPLAKPGKMKRSEGVASFAAAPPEMEMMDEAAVLKEAVPASFEAAQIVTGIQTEFVIAREQTIPSDGSERKMGITGLSLKSPLLARTSPKLEQAAFLTSEVENAGEVPLLAGDVDIFRDGAFVGTGRIDEVLPGQHFRLSLGRDPNFAVKREYVASKTGQSGFFSKEVERQYRYRIELENYHKSARRLVVYDQLPVSRDERIQVTLDPRTTPVNSGEADPDYLDERFAKAVQAPERPPKPGTLAWQFDLQPGAKQTVELYFTVRAPKGVEVEGL